jgi:hypothetical protein
VKMPLQSTLVVSLFLRFGLPVLFGGPVQYESYGEILFAVSCRHDLPLERGFDSEEGVAATRFSNLRVERLNIFSG